jgi:DNA-binding IclR family transcriptional regulator
VSEPRVIASLVKGLRILECLASSGEGLRAGQIAEALLLPRANLNLFLNSLMATGYAIKNPVDGLYYISDKLVHVASSVPPNAYSRLDAAARPPMERLHERYDENVMLGVLNLHRLRILVRLQSTRSLQIVNDAEMEYTPHVTAGGKVILANLPPERLKAYLAHAEFERFTSRSLMDREVLAAELCEIKMQGYAVNRAEYQEDVMAVAAPVFEGEQVLAAIILQFPVFRHRQDELEENAGLVVEAARAATSALAEGV